MGLVYFRPFLGLLTPGVRHLDDIPHWELEPAHLVGLPAWVPSARTAGVPNGRRSRPCLWLWSPEKKDFETHMGGGDTVERLISVVESNPRVSKVPFPFVPPRKMHSWGFSGAKTKARFQHGTARFSTRPVSLFPAAGH